jgi:uncharacterized protein YaaR (DUF327 family)
MDRVDASAVSFLNAFNSDLKPGVKKTKDKDDLRLRRTLFSEMVDKSIAGELGPIRELAPSEEALTELMDAVHSAGSDLLDRPFPDEILKYKKAVRNFVHYILENGYELQKLQGVKKKAVIRGEAEWKTMVYHQIRVVDQKLEDLAAAILSGQADKLERVSRLDELRGLLVDLTVTGIIRDRDD